MIDIEKIERLSASTRKLIGSLASAKWRREHSLFVTERTKNVLELLDSHFRLRYLVANHAWFEAHRQLKVDESRCRMAKNDELERMTTLAAAPDVLAVFEIPDDSVLPAELKSDRLYVALDSIQDPGNLGTIMRIADWFGVDTIFAGAGTVDVFNPKCIIASMGSVARVRVVYTDLADLLDRASALNIDVWGTFIDGESIYSLPASASPTGIVVMGNEGNGIGDEIAAKVNRRISIPPYPADRHGAESLNVAMATAITLAEFRRRATTH